MPNVETIYKSFSITKERFENKMIAWEISDNPLCRTWSFRDNHFFGVLFPVSDRINSEINESFAGVDFYIARYNIDGYADNMLCLTSRTEETRKQFASVCFDFTREDSRDKIIANPFEWWESWKQLLGNYQKSNTPYSLIGEMVVVDWLLRNGHKPSWNSKSTPSTIDIISLDDSIGHEVKTTSIRYGNIIHMSGQFQISSNPGKTYLYFLRFEELDSGVYTIDQMRKQLISHGYGKDILDEKLEKSPFRKGKRDRLRKYNLLEFKRFIVDDKFPLITDSCFSNGFPNGIIHLEYDVDLSNIPYEEIDYSM